MSSTPLPSLRELFPSEWRRPVPFTSTLSPEGLTSSADLIRPRGDDHKTYSRPITAKLVLDKANPDAHPEQHSPTTPASPTRHRRGSDPGHGPPPSEVVSPVDTEDCYNDKTRKHVCHICGKRFNRPSSLTIHYHTHTGERREYYQFPFLPFP